MGKEIVLRITTPTADMINPYSIDIIGEYILGIEIGKILEALCKENIIEEDTYTPRVEVERAQNPSDLTVVEVNGVKMVISLPTIYFKN